MKNSIRILSIEKNYVHSGVDKIIIDLSYDKLIEILHLDNWTLLHKNTITTISKSLYFWKYIDGLKVGINVDIFENNKVKTEIVCRDWWFNKCIKYFNLKKIN